MRTYDRVTLMQKAQHFGFQYGVFEKVCRLIEILRFINETDELSKYLALKGGTAINLTVFDLPRLSVDIDFDFTENLSKEDTQEKRDRIKDTIQRYMSAEGYTLTPKSKSTYILDSFIYAYTNVAGNSDNIKIEINYILRSHIFITDNVMIQNSEITVPFNVRTLNPIEIFASKIVALAGRAAPRDLYDISNMIHNGIFGGADVEILRKCAVFYLAATGGFTMHCLDAARIESITPYKIKTDLSPMIRKAERFSLPEARKRVTSFINEQMSLADGEVEFLKKYEGGSYIPNLLFEEDEHIKRIENHPMILWRLLNIKNK